MSVKFLHSMLRVSDPDAAISFFGLIGLEEVRRYESQQGRFTLIFLATPADEAKGASVNKTPLLELTHNWDETEYAGGRNFGHLAYRVDDIYATCSKLMKAGVTINRPPRDGYMAFVKSPDGISIELLQKGEAKAAAEPWASMGNTGSW
jgi:lactoylglutathione lyase